MSTNLSSMGPLSPASPTLPSVTEKNATPSAKDIREMIRERMQHEDNLVNHRISWLLVSQGFLFAAFAQVLTKEMPHQSLILVTIGVFGVFICLVAILSIRGAIKAIEELENFWENKDKVNQAEREKLPPISYTGKLDKAEIAAYGIPAFAILAWIVLLLAISS